MIAFVVQLLNFALSVLFWLILGRYVLDLLVGDRRNFFTDLFRRGTDPVFAVVRRITPAFVGSRHIPWISLLLLVLLRLLLLPLLRLEG